MYAVNKSTSDTQLGATRKIHPKELLNAIKELDKNIKTKTEYSVLLPQSRALEEAIWSSQLIEPLKDADDDTRCRPPHPNRIGPP